MAEHVCKPCPFCGAEGYVTELDFGNGVRRRAGRCSDDDCGASVMPNAENGTLGFLTECEAAAAWNKRTAGLN